MLAAGAEAAATDPEVENLERGYRIYRDNCRACHLDTGWGNISIDCPSIAALPRWYLSGQLRSFRSGHRGGHREDEKGKLMTNVAAHISNTDIAFLGKYIESLQAIPNRTTTNEFNVKRGEKIYRERCVECHGESAKGDRKSRTPPLNLQQDWYLMNQMWKFSIEARTHKADLKIDIDIAKEAGDIAAYLASLDAD